MEAQTSILSASSKMSSFPVGLANRYVYSWNGDLLNQVSLQKSGVRKPYVFSRHSADNQRLPTKKQCNVKIQLTFNTQKCFSRGMNIMHLVLLLAGFDKPLQTLVRS
ncbi:uncharacterized protein J3R85_019583 [Psidium guajava]|nr:uncharacterized protein J3R85_019583 [Psidium guajava]